MPAHTRAALAYKESAVENAPPLKVLRMLYEGALRFLEQARELDQKSQAAARNDRVHRADAIVCELRCHLQHELAPELCAELERLYLFVEGELDRAILERSNEPIDNAERVLRTLLDAWKQVEVPPVCSSDAA